MATLYHWHRCSTCRKVRDDLKTRRRNFDEWDFFDRPLTTAQIAELAAGAGGARRIFSFNSPSFRAVGRPPDSVPEQELIELMASEPRLIRRPILVAAGKLFVGSREIAAASEE